MYSCKQVSMLLPQYVADGEPATATYQALRQHLKQCSACQAQAEGLRVVEVALRTMPRAMPSAELAQVLVAEALEAQRMEQELRTGVVNNLGWDVLVPALTLIVALLMVVQLVPADAWPVVQQASSEVVALSQPIPLDGLLQGRANGQAQTIFWAMWVALASILGGVGLALGLNAWSDRHAKRLDALEQQVLDTAQRMVHRTWRSS